MNLWDRLLRLADRLGFDVWVEGGTVHVWDRLMRPDLARKFERAFPSLVIQIV